MLSWNLSPSNATYWFFPKELGCQSTTSLTHLKIVILLSNLNVPTSFMWHSFQAFPQTWTSGPSAGSLFWWPWNRYLPCSQYSSWDAAVLCSYRPPGKTFYDFPNILYYSGIPPRVKKCLYLSLVCPLLTGSKKIQVFKTLNLLKKTNELYLLGLQMNLFKVFS